MRKSCFGDTFTAETNEIHHVYEITHHAGAGAGAVGGDSEKVSSEQQLLNNVRTSLKI